MPHAKVTWDLRQTDITENIIFPQLRWRAVITISKFLRMSRDLGLHNLNQGGPDNQRPNDYSSVYMNEEKYGAMCMMVEIITRSTCTLFNCPGGAGK